ncbi:MAG: hypothetical protein LAT57_00090 [Balneolales bacterium]|nr:hypothetical protein [Balneolales bacterium]
MESIIKPLSHIRASLVNIEAAYRKANADGLSRYRSWDVNNTKLPVSIGRTDVYGLKAFNPNDEVVYLRLYNEFNPDYATDKPEYIIELPGKSGITLEVRGLVRFAMHDNLVIMATSSFQPTGSAEPTSSIFVDIRYDFSLPELPEGQSFLTDSQGNYLIDSEGNYLTT